MSLGKTGYHHNLGQWGAKKLSGAFSGVSVGGSSLGMTRQVVLGSAPARDQGSDNRSKSFLSKVSPGKNLSVSAPQKTEASVSNVSKTRGVQQDVQHMKQAALQDVQAIKREVLNAVEGDLALPSPSMGIISVGADLVMPGAAQWLLEAVAAKQDLDRKPGKVQAQIDEALVKLRGENSPAGSVDAFPGQDKAPSVPVSARRWDQVTGREVKDFMERAPETLPEIEKLEGQAAFLETLEDEQVMTLSRSFELSAAEAEQAGGSLGDIRDVGGGLKFPRFSLDHDFCKALVRANQDSVIQLQGAGFTPILGGTP